jgi:hypothetical protein
MIIIISDLFDDPEVIMRRYVTSDTGAMRSSCFTCWIKNELEFPFQRLTVFEDIEDTAVRVLSDPRAIRAAYLQQHGGISSRIPASLSAVKRLITVCSRLTNPTRRGVDTLFGTDGNNFTRLHG